MITLLAATISAYLTGNQLLAACESASNSQKGMCVGYVTGVADMISATEGYGIKKVSCVPDEVTQQQIADVATAYLKANPAKRHVSASRLVDFALNAAWPCPKK